MTPSNVVQLYSDSLIFQAIPATERHKLLISGRKFHYDKDETIFSQGEDGNWMLLIEEGLVEVSVIAPDGRKSVLNHMQAGSVLGEVALLDKQGRSADAVAITPVTGIRLSRDAVIQFLKQNNEACLAIIDTLCERVRNASSMFETRALTSASARLARCLLRFADKWGVDKEDGAILIDQAISQTLLGEFAGVARENVNRYMQAWTQQGILVYRKTGITLLDINKLEDLVE